MKTRLILGILVSAILISCKAKMEESTLNIHRKWMLIQFENFQKETLIEKQCYLDLTDQKNAMANMGCNSLGFVYELKNDNEILFNQGRTTHMYCEDNAIESQFLSIVNTISFYTMEGHKLYLRTTKDKELIFVAEDWD